MNNQYMDMANMLLNSPNGANIMKNLGKLKQIIDTPEGKKFISNIAQNKSDSLKEAINAISSNDKAKAKAILSGMVSGADGEKIVSQILKVLEG